MNQPLQIKKRGTAEIGAAGVKNNNVIGKKTSFKAPREGQDLSDVDEEEEKRMAMAFTEVKQEGLYRDNRAVTMIGKKKDGRPKGK